MPLMRLVSKCIPKQMRLYSSFLRKPSALSDGSRRSPGSAFQATIFE